MDVRLEGDEDDAGLESAIMILIKRREKSRVKLQDRNSKSHHDECLHVDVKGGPSLRTSHAFPQKSDSLLKNGQQLNFSSHFTIWGSISPKVYMN